MLDMYLVRKINKGFNVPRNGFCYEGFWRNSRTFPPFDCPENTDGIGDFEEVLFLRKANAIHRWFVENVQGGKDSGRVYLVQSRKLKELRMECLYVLADPIRAPELLPVQKGSYYGSYEYDEQYFESLREMVNCLDSLNLDEDDIYYDSCR